MDRPSKSLDYKNLGPFKIIKAINNIVYELDLPTAIKGIYLDNSNPLPG